MGAARSTFNETGPSTRQLSIRLYQSSQGLRTTPASTQCAFRRAPTARRPIESAPAMANPAPPASDILGPTARRLKSASTLTPLPARCSTLPLVLLTKGGTRRKDRTAACHSIQTLHRGPMHVGSVCLFSNPQRHTPSLLVSHRINRPTGPIGPATTHLQSALPCPRTLTQRYRAGLLLSRPS